MRNMLAFLAAVALTVAGAGWYLGWYRVQSAPLPSGHHRVNIDIDGDKVNEDLHKGGRKVLETTNHKIQEVLEKNRKNESGPQGDEGPGEPPTARQ